MFFRLLAGSLLNVVDLFWFELDALQKSLKYIESIWKSEKLFSPSHIIVDGYCKFCPIMKQEDQNDPVLLTWDNQQNMDNAGWELSNTISKVLGLGGSR